MSPKLNFQQNPKYHQIFYVTKTKNDLKSKSLLHDIDFDCLGLIKANFDFIKISVREFF